MLFKYLENDGLNCSYINTNSIATVDLYIPEKKVIIEYQNGANNRISLNFKTIEKAQEFISQLQEAMA